jgi:hypothetical protein
VQASKIFFIAIADDAVEENCNVCRNSERNGVATWTTP